jgi:hypothetical protein
MTAPPNLPAWPCRRPSRGAGEGQRGITASVLPFSSNNHTGRDGDLHALLLGRVVHGEVRQPALGHDAEDHAILVVSRVRQRDVWLAVILSSRVMHVRTRAFWITRRQVVSSSPCLALARSITPAAAQPSTAKIFTRFMVDLRVGGETPVGSRSKPVPVRTMSSSSYGGQAVSPDDRGGLEVDTSSFTRR